MAATANFVNKVLAVSEFLTSSSSSDDEIMSLVSDRKNRPKDKHFLDIVREFSQEEFKQNFRLKKETAYSIINQYEISQFHPSCDTHGGSPPMTAEHDILTFLWFASNKVTLRDLALRFGVTKSTSFIQIKRVMGFLIDIAPSIIKFPSNKKETATEFYNIAQFPNTLGCIDGTSIKIRTPKHKIKSTYVNRHDIPSITLQAICDARKRFTDISVGTPGKIHDARVFQLSDISTELPQICERKYHVIGDSAYPIREWLLVPFRDYGNLNNDEKLYNKKFCATRVLIENSFGLLKGRFRQLIEIDMQKVDKICNFITSCCVLHNLCINHDDEYIFDEIQENAEEDEFNYLNESDQQLKKLGERKRNAVMRRLCDDISDSSSDVGNI